jgi:hypothetical protein
MPPLTARTTADLLAALEGEARPDLAAPLAAPGGERQIASLWAGYGRVTELTVVDGGGSR